MGIKAPYPPSPYPPKGPYDYIRLLGYFDAQAMPPKSPTLMGVSEN